MQHYNDEEFLKHYKNLLNISKKQQVKQVPIRTMNQKIENLKEWIANDKSDKSITAEEKKGIENELNNIKKNPKGADSQGRLITYRITREHDLPKLNHLLSKIDPSFKTTQDMLAHAEKELGKSDKHYPRIVKAQAELERSGDIKKALAVLQGDIACSQK
jgi:hypothetical protein